MAVGFPAKTTFANGNTLPASDLNDITGTLNSIMNGGGYTAIGGLQLVKTQTIGTAVASVTVTGAFSTTYDNYKIIITGGVMAVENIWSLRLGATTTGYYAGLTATNYGGSAVNAGYSNQASIFVGAGQTGSFNSNIEIGAPFLSKASTFSATFSRITTTSGYSANVNGYLNDSTSYTDFTITTASTWTGGTIYVYGYQKG